MTLALHVLTTLAVLGTGWAALALAFGERLADRSLPERLGLAYFIGLALVLAELYVSGAFGWMKLPLLLAPPAVLFAIAARRRLRATARTGVSPARVRERLRAWHIALLALIGLEIAWVVVMNLHELWRTDDAFKIALPFAKDAYLARDAWNYAMPRGYPKFPGLAVLLFELPHREWDEFAANLVYANDYVFLLLLFGGNLLTFAGLSVAVASTYVLGSLPLLLSHAVQIGYSDLPMVCYLTAASLYVHRWAVQRRREDLALAIAFTAILPTIKPEGLVPFAFVVAGVLIAIETNRRFALPARTIAAACLLLIGATIGLLAWLARVFGEATPPLVSSEIWKRIRPGDHWSEIGPPLLEHFGYPYNNWMVLGALLPFALLAFTWRARRRPEFFVGLLGLLLVASFCYVFFVGGAYVFLVRGTTVNRFYLQIVPTLLYGCAVMLAQDRIRKFRWPSGLA